MAASDLQKIVAHELLHRRNAVENLSSFREYMAPTGSVDFQNVPAAHHRLIITHLEALERGEIQRLMILAPPGSAKSTYASIQYPLWRLARRPNRNILCASNTQDLAENFNRRRRNVALTPDWMTLAGTKLAADLQGAGHFGTDKQGGIRAAGVGSAIVGFRSHLNVLDDPIRGMEEAMSRTVLDKQWEWFNHEFRTRLAGDSQNELIVSTRWAKNDIAGRLLQTEAARWTVLRLPMLADRDDDPLGRRLDDPLWPEYFGPAYITEKQKNVLLWSTQYQQTPLDESGAWVGVEHLVYEDMPDQELRYVIALDLALSVGQGDYTVMVVAGIDAQRHIHIVHVERQRVSPEKTVERFFELCEAFPPMECLVDDDNASKVFVRLLAELAKAQGKAPPPLRPQPMRGRHKETRAAAIRGLFLSGSVRIVRSHWTTALVQELLEFPSGEHDDQVDALGLIGRRFPTLSSPAPTVESQDPYDGKLIRPDGTRYVLNIPLEQLFQDNDSSRRNRNRI